MSRPESVVRACMAQQLTVATAESLTAGLIAATLADVPGCSSVLRGGVVSYASDVKADVLGVDRGLLDHVVSEPVAAAMAVAAARLMGADLGVAATGVAGPDQLDHQPPGTVWIAVHDARPGRTMSRLLHLPGSRAEVRHGAVDAALAMLLEAIGQPGNT